MKSIHLKLFSLLNMLDRASLAHPLHISMSIRSCSARGAATHGVEHGQVPERIEPTWKAEAAAQRVCEIKQRDLARITQLPVLHPEVWFE
jgi:hypothetical protein